MVVEIGGGGELASVQRRIAQAIHPGARLDAQRDEVAPGTGDDDACGDDFAVLRGPLCAGWGYSGRLGSHSIDPLARLIGPSRILLEVTAFRSPVAPARAAA